MNKIEMTPYDFASRFIGVHERAGEEDHPLIRYCHSLCGLGFDQHDEVPWCSAFMNFVFFCLALPRSGSAAARSWLKQGVWVPLNDAEAGFDVVVLMRGSPPQPGPEVIAAPGHVGLFSGWDDSGATLRLLAGNQGDEVNISRFPASCILAIRRIV